MDRPQVQFDTSKAVEVGDERRTRANAPMPGISPAQTLPLQTGQTRQAPLNFSRARRRISPISIIKIPFLPEVDLFGELIL
jgi:hypothetical protein